MSRFLCIGVVLSLGGCATLPSPDDQTEAQRRFRDREVQLDSHQAWTLTGRVAVRSGDEGWSARIRWIQRGDRYQIRVTAPLSQGAFQIAGSPGQVTLQTPEDQMFSAAGPEELMDQHLGWSLPLGGLSYWVRGISSPSAAIDNLRLDEHARLVDLQQSGWRISVLNYQKIGAMELPKRLFMLSDRLDVRLAIQQWQFEP